ncbi:hypothetical protein J4423_04910 [Candidatus Pacearchaeota archaeon]|nr:hypothetical protein [Candidatus Pacearchaeota archaeon]
MKNYYIFFHNTFSLGHFQRCKLLAERLVRNNNSRVFLISLGNKFPITKFSSNIHFIQLSPIYKKISSNKILTLKNYSDKLKDRISKILHLFKKYPPNLFITEYYPFGWFRQSDILNPIIKHIKKNYSNCALVCSARDIPIPNCDKMMSEVKLKKTINQYYDLVLIHAPKNITAFRNEGYFENLKFKIPLKFTGYIVDLNDLLNIKRKIIPNSILITIGGGRDGYDAINKTLNSIIRLSNFKNLNIKIVSGHFNPVKYFRQFDCFKNVMVYSYIPQLIKEISRSQLIVSMAGYNSVAEIKYCLSNALLIPRNDSFEQNERAKLATNNKNVLIHLPKDKDSDLSLKIFNLLKLNSNICYDDHFNYDGVNQSVNFIFELLKKKFKNENG